MDAFTAVPLALGLRQVPDGRLDTPGVHPPESVIETKLFFDGLASACDPPVQGMEELVARVENAQAG